MAIEIRINKEIGDYEPKLLGPLTARQTVCVAIATPVCIYIYKYLAPILTGDVAGFFVMIPAVIAYLFGWPKPYGMRTEKFFQSIFVTTLLAPANRPYKTENHHESMLKNLAAEFKEPDEEQKNSSRRKKQQKTRYKVSPLAVE